MAIEYSIRIPPKEAFFQLFQTTGWNEEYQLRLDQLYEALQHSWDAVSALDDGRLVGFGRVIADGVLHALIVDMIVLPSHQNRGIGRAILNRLVERCRASGIRDIQLFCARGKSGFYERCGFLARPEDAPGMECKRPEVTPQTVLR